MPTYPDTDVTSFVLERAEELGGVLEAGRRPGRGWRVRAVLPVGGSRPDGSGGAGAVEETRVGEGTG